MESLTKRKPKLNVRRMRQCKVLFGLFLVFLTIIFLIIVSVDHSVQNLIRKKQFLTPTLYYGSPKKFYRNQVYSSNQFESYFKRRNYRKRDFGSSIQKGDFILGQTEDCHQVTGIQENVFSCLLFRNQDSRIYFIELDEQDRILNIFSGESVNKDSKISVDRASFTTELYKKFKLNPVLFAQGESESFAQFLGGKPIQQKKVLLDEIPRYCLDAIIAIEDNNFLKHQGISFRAIFRALLTNLRTGSWSQGEAQSPNNW